MIAGQTGFFRGEVHPRRKPVEEKGALGMAKLIRSLAVCVCNLFLVVLSCYAQQTLGSINGTVVDSSGAVLQKATVRIRNLATNDERTVLTKRRWLLSCLGSTDRYLRAYFFTRRLRDRDPFKNPGPGRSHGHRQRLLAARASSYHRYGHWHPLLNQTDMTNGYTLGKRPDRKYTSWNRQLHSIGRLGPRRQCGFS
jgi:hypothetical protein